MDMLTENELLLVIDAYAAATDASDKTISSRVFDDGKKLAALRDGKDISVRRANLALQWFSDNWPDDAEWPRGIVRPFRRILETSETPALVSEKAAGVAR